MFLMTPPPRQNLMNKIFQPNYYCYANTGRIFITLYCCLLVVMLIGCKKKSESVPDYNCNCQPYGKNALSLFIHQATALYPYETDKHRWGFIDQIGSTVINASYAGTGSFSNNRALIVDDKNGIEFAGFIDAAGSIAVPTNYRLILNSYYSSDGLIPIGDVKKWLFGYIDMGGQVRVPFKYAYGTNFHEGLAVVLLGNKVGAIDGNDNIVIPFNYESMTIFSEGLAFASKVGERKGYITPSNQYKFQGDFIQGTIFMYGRAAVDNPPSGGIGFIDTTGQFVIPPIYAAVNIFSEGLAAVQFNGKWGFIDTSGNFIIEPQFEDVVAGFCNGLAPVKKNAQWGYIDRTGGFVIPPQFDDADVFYCDLAKVWFLDGTAGYVNKSGKIVYRSAHPLKSKANFPKIANTLSKFNIGKGKK